MKRKFLSVAMTVVMAVVCLTGCSGNFSKNSFISAARKYGMKEIEDDMELRDIDIDRENSNSAYYVEKDYERMQFLFSGLEPDAEVKELVKAVEIIGCNDNQVSCSTNAYYLTAKDSKNAKKIYKALATQFVNPGESETYLDEGEKDGITYTIGYFIFDDITDANDRIEAVYGVYLKDDKVIWIYSVYDSTLENSCFESFCKSLGLVSPYTLKET